MTSKIELEVIEGWELEFLRPYILDYIQSNRVPYLFQLKKEYAFPLAYNEGTVSRLFNLLIDEEEAEMVMESAYDKIKSRARYSESYQDFTSKSVDDFINSEKGGKIVSLIQSHLITAFADDGKVNYFDRQLSLYLASSYFYFKNYIKTDNLVNPQSIEEVERVFEHLRAIYELLDKSAGKGYKYQVLDMADYGKVNPDIYSDLKGFTIHINNYKLASSIDKDTNVRSFAFYSEDDLIPDMFIKIPQEYYFGVIFDDLDYFNFSVWYEFVDTSNIWYSFSNSYYARILLEEAFELDNEGKGKTNEKIVLQGIESNYNNLLDIIKFKREDVLSNTMSSYNKYFIGKMYDLISECYPSYKDPSKYFIISSILVELGIAKTLEEYSGGQRYNEYLKDFVKNALRIPQY
jgi:hypothetical protein